MPNIYIKANCSFEGSDTAWDTDGKFGDDARDFLTILFKIENDLDVSLELEKSNIIEGNLDVAFESPSASVVCNAVFKVSVKPQYIDDALANNNTWYLDKKVNGVMFPKISASSGIQEEQYEFMKFGQTKQGVRYILTDLVASKDNKF